MDSTIVHSPGIFHRRIKNPVKHLRWNFLWIFCKETALIFGMLHHLFFTEDLRWLLLKFILTSLLLLWNNVRRLPCWFWRCWLYLWKCDLELIILMQFLTFWHHTEAVARSYSVKKVFLKISQNSQENTCARVSFLIKLQAFIKKETLAQVFSCKFVKF